jgi:hypothetical protein
MRYYEATMATNDSWAGRLFKPSPYHLMNFILLYLTHSLRAVSVPNSVYTTDAK